MNTKLIGSYSYNDTSQDQLGIGTFGTVFKGKNVYTQELVAIKVLNASALSDPSQKDNISNEINALKLIGQNPNVVKLIDVLQSANHIYIIQEYCNGGDFRHYLNQYNNFPENQALNILKQLVNAFVQMAKQGIVHRDLKPENILIHRDTFKITDFGFAKCVDNFSKGMLQSLLGTPLYMSPQLLMNHPYTSKCDVWSLGLIYYEMLVGKTPWLILLNFSFFLQDKLNLKLSQSIKQKKLVYNFHTELIQVSKFNESQRLSFEEVFLHPLFNDCFNYRNKIKEFNKLTETIIYQFIQQLSQKQINLEKWFQQMDANYQQQLTFNDFHKLLLQMNSNLTREECEHVFNTFDQTGYNLISYQDFKQTLKNVEIKYSQNFSSQQQQTHQIYAQTYPQNNQQQQQSSSYDKFRNKLFIGHQSTNIPQQQEQQYNNNQNQYGFLSPQLIQSPFNFQNTNVYFLIEQIKEQFGNQTEFSLRQLFDLFDIDQTNSLNFKQFYGLIDSKNIKLTKEQAYEIFQFLDQNYQQKISFSQFSSIFALH